MLTTSLQCTAEFTPKLSSMRPFSTVHSQAVAGQPRRHFYSGGSL